MIIPGINNWKFKQGNIIHPYDRIARIISVNKTNYNIATQSGEVLGELSGKLIYSYEKEIDLPVAGDFVVIDLFDDLAIIHEVLPRFSFLKRKTAGKKIEFQSIAANIDVAFIVQAVDTDFNLRRLERYLAMIYDGNIEPVLVLTKTDLVSDEELNDKILQIKNIYHELKIFSLSNITKNGIDQLSDLLEKDKTYCLLGSSGVGKSTLINNLIGKEVLETQEVRESDRRGKHTTTRRELIVLENGSILIDTPGMRELGNFSFDEGLVETFSEINELINSCKYSDCNHINDLGCALIKAVDDGIISEDRYKSFLKLKKESAYYESSYVEKRKKDKEFGKMVKSIIKHKKDKR